MKRVLKSILKHMVLFLIGGSLYINIELLFRGYSHWTMFILGGLCFVSIGLINEFLSWKTSIIIQSLIGAVIITALEYITGYIVNIKLRWDIWNYSNMLFNINGQICLLFSLIWIFIAAIAIIVDDYLRYWIFKEQKPKYIII
jgi:uncharacterized membrane protein